MTTTTLATLFPGAIPYLLIVASLVFHHRYWRHSVAMLGGFIGIFQLFDMATLALFPHWPSIQHYFWVALAIINSGFVLRAIWLINLPMGPEESHLYHRYFSSFSRSNFKKLMNIGKFENKANGALLVKQGSRMEYVICILDGSAGVMIDNEKVASLINGDFIGEMSFLSGNLSSATVRLEVLSRLVMWKQEDLRSLLKKNPSLLVEFNRAIERQIAAKLFHGERPPQ